MDLYELLSRNYDQLFPVSGQEAAFLEHHLSDRRKLLDIGCGSGSKTVLLAASREVMGIDASREMIELAQRDHSSPTVRYRILGMQDLSLLPAADFDSAICLGNTLPHLSQPGQLPDVLSQVKRLLLNEGVLLGQIINFDRIIEERADSLPTLETETVIFRRGYEWQGSAMSFCIELEDKATGRIERGRTPMRPILKSDLDNALRTAGFGRTEYYGSFSGEPYNTGTYHLIFKTTHVNA